MPERVLSQVIPPMLAASAYRELVLISTPWGRGNRFFHASTRGVQGDPAIRSFHFPSRSNPHLSSEYLERQRAELTELAWRTEYEAEFLDDQASVFRQELVEAAVDPSIEEGTVLAGHSYSLGFDPAKFRDRSALVVVDRTQLPYRVVQVADLAGRDYLARARAVARLAARYNDAAVLLDETSHAQMLEQLLADGVIARGYRFTSASKAELIDALVLAFERRELRLPPHPDLLRELRYYQYQLTRAGNVKLGAAEGPGMFDDLVTALALGVWQGGGQRDWIPGYEDPEAERRIDEELRRELDEEELAEWGAW